MSNDLLEAADDYGEMGAALRDAIGDAVDEGTTELAQAALTRAQRNVNNATGALRNSLRAQTRTTATDVDATWQATERLTYTRRLAVPERYKYVEFGTGQNGERIADVSVSGSSLGNYPAPSSAPYWTILEWMQDAGIPPRKATRSDSAWAIARTIREEGQQPHPFLRPAWRSSVNGWRNVQRLVEDSVEDIVTDTVRS